MSRTKSRREKRFHLNIFEGIAWNAFQIETLENRMLLSANPAPPGSGIFGSNTYIGSPLQATEFDTSAITVNPGATVTIDVKVLGEGTPPMTPTGSVYASWGGGGTEGTVSVNIPLSGSDGTATGSTAFTLPTDDISDSNLDYISCYYTGDSYYASAEFSVQQPTLFVNFNSTNQLAFIQQPSNSAVGDKIAPPVTVQEQLPSGSPIGNGTAPITLSVASGNGILAGTLTEPAINGIATFSDLSIDTSGTYTLSATASNFTPVASSLFTIADNKLVFDTPPVDGTANDPLKPIVVKLEDGNSNVETNDSTTVITLTPVGFTSGNPIKNNTATVVNGVARFSNVILTKPGFYQLQATDAAGDANATSGKFKVAGDHLAFIKQPTGGDTDVALPLTVEIENSKNQPVTDASTTIVLSLNVISGGVNAQLGGTVSLGFAGGRASFTPTAGPSINTPGVFTLTATEEDFSTGVLAPTNTTTAITSKPFNIKGYHLAFSRQPADTSSGDVVPFSISLLDTKNKPVKTGAHADENLTIAVSPSVSAGNNTPASGMHLYSGLYVADDALGGPFIDNPGVYTVTVTAQTIDGNGNASDDPIVASVQSKQFKVLGLHLAFKIPPKDTNAGDIVLFTVDLLDAKNKPVDSGTHADENLTVVLTPSANAGNNTPANGMHLYAGEYITSDALGGPFVNTPGTYTVTITAQTIDNNGNAANDPVVALVQSKQFKILGLHLKFQIPPKDTNADNVIPFTVNLLDSKNQPVKSGSHADENFTISITPAANGGNTTPTNAMHFSSGIYISSDALGGPFINDLGTYVATITAQTTDSNGNPISDPVIAPVQSKQFKVLGLHLAFEVQPKDTDAGDVVAFTANLLDSKNKPVDTGSHADDALAITISPTANGGNNTPAGGMHLYSGVYIADDKLGGPFIDDPGTYVVTVTPQTADANNNPVNDPVVASIQSKQFKILPLHLAFQLQPKDTKVGDVVSFTVVLLDSANQPVKTGPRADDSLTVVVTPTANGGNNTPAGGMHLYSGVYISNDQLGGPLINDPGTYSITVTALTVDANGNTIDDPVLTSIQSGSFTID